MCRYLLEGAAFGVCVPRGMVDVWQLCMVALSTRAVDVVAVAPDS
jgi:hypothetical protein